MLLIYPHLFPESHVVPKPFGHGLIGWLHRSILRSISMQINDFTLDVIADIFYGQIKLPRVCSGFGVSHAENACKYVYACAYKNRHTSTSQGISNHTYTTVERNSLAQVRIMLRIFISWIQRIKSKPHATDSSEQESGHEAQKQGSCLAYHFGECLLELIAP